MSNTMHETILSLLQRDVQSSLVQAAHLGESKFMAWLSPLDGVDRENCDTHAHHRGATVLGTTDWLLNDPTYLEWANSKTASCLWLRGFVGCGKSFLTAAAIDHQRSIPSDNESCPVVFFYFNRKEVTHTEILGWLLKQVITHIPRRSQEALWSRSLKRRLSDEDVLESLISISADSAGFTIFLDGGDQCSPNVIRNLLGNIQKLQELAASRMSFVRLFVASNDTPAMRRQLSLFPMCSINVPERNSQAICTFIEHRTSRESFRRLAKVDSPKELNASLSTVAAGMFLWVDHTLEWLVADGQYMYEHRLKSIGQTSPPGLSRYYELVLQEDLENCVDDNEKEVVYMILNLLIYGLPHPDSASCLLPQICSHVSKSSPEGQSEWSVEDIISMSPLLLTSVTVLTSAPLGSIDVPTSHMKTNSPGSIGFVHPSVRHFLINHGSENFCHHVGNELLAAMCGSFMKLPKHAYVPLKQHSILYRRRYVEASNTALSNIEDPSSLPHR